MKIATLPTPSSVAYTWTELHFQINHNGPNDPKGNETGNIKKFIKQEM